MYEFGFYLAFVHLFISGFLTCAIFFCLNWFEKNEYAEILIIIFVIWQILVTGSLGLAGFVSLVTEVMGWNY